MPNHVTHRIVLKGPQKELKRFLRFISERDGEQILDFDKLIPMPPEIADADKGSYGELGFDAWYGTDERVAQILTYPWVSAEGVTDRKGLQQLFLKMNPQYKSGADQYKSNIEKYGVPTGYEWAIQNWGTKWNSYNFSIVRSLKNLIEILFDTAWSTPEPVFLELSRRLPKLFMSIRAYDDGGGFACEGILKGGAGLYECGDATERLERLVYRGPKGVLEWRPDEPQEED